MCRDIPLRLISIVNDFQSTNNNAARSDHIPITRQKHAGVILCAEKPKGGNQNGGGSEKPPPHECLAVAMPSLGHG